MAKELGIEYAVVGVPKRLPFDGNSYLSVQHALIDVWGSFPIRLIFDRDYERLKAMAAACGAGGVAYAVLADALKRAGDLELRDLSA